IYFSNPKCIIPIGLTNTNQINLLKEQGLIDYVNKTKEESINSIVDMEKDVYTPVVYGGIDKDEKPIFDNIIGIKFNLHFRDRNLSDGKWLTETGSLWNGIEKGDKKFNEDYFSYNDKNKQSDLLSYLGFTDNDVRYQKSKLKKSFLRISFYDSMNMGDQNLLAYSTIYMNGGEYFSKYIRHINDESYHKSGEEGVLKGIRVNREPNVDLVVNDEEKEEYRLSSQIKVFDKYNSNSSSEGFYLYLYKDLFMPTDGNQTLTLYAKVEFNHAGYGRTVPFMMPYWDKNKWNGEKRNGVEYGVKTGIKSFNEIRKDWLSDHIIDKGKDNNIVKDYWQFVDTGKDKEEEIVDKDENGEDKEDKSEITDGQYGAKQYTKFSYIRFKITYD
ncbi:MAG: hypothetical protein K2H20_01995, partial [Bacilli bacterium]|nr:hypothetical protein [Bacilli bacterium]